MRRCRCLGWWMVMPACSRPFTWHRTGGTGGMSAGSGITGAADTGEAASVAGATQHMAIDGQGRDMAGDTLPTTSHAGATGRGLTTARADITGGGFTIGPSTGIAPVITGPASIADRGLTIGLTTVGCTGLVLRRLITGGCTCLVARRAAADRVATTSRGPTTTRGPITRSCADLVAFRDLNVKIVVARC